MEDNLITMLQSMKPNLICFICKDLLVKPMKYKKCQHTFCSVCISKTWANENCPRCGLYNSSSAVSDLIIERLAEFWYNACKKLGVEKDYTDKVSLKKIAYEKFTSRSKKSKRSKNAEAKTKKKTVQKKKNMLDISISKSESGLNKSVNNSTEGGLENNTSHKEDISKPGTSRSDNSTIDKLNSTIVSATNIEKRNIKGETALHIACVKGNIEKLKMLLSLGAKLNTKDNAGWTPLQEAAGNGHEEIVKILLENNATPDMPGYQNSTPLHIAVNNNHLSIAKMLLQHGCNKYARNSHNQTPESLCTSDEMREILNNTSMTAPLISLSQQIVVEDEGPSKIVFYSPELDKTKVKKLAAVINTLGSNVIRTFKMDLTITHILVSTNADLVGTLSVTVLLALLLGKWIISDRWLDSSSSNHIIASIEKFEIRGTISRPHSYAAKRARISHINQLPGLFNGCHFYFWGPATDAKLGDLMVSRYNLKTMVEYGGGVVLKREPNPELIPESEKTSPYHIKSTSSLKNCSHFIIYRTDIPEPILKYNMPHIKSLPLQWMINCIENFKIIEPSQL